MSTVIMLVWFFLSVILLLRYIELVAARFFEIMVIIVAGMIN